MQSRTVGGKVLTPLLIAVVLVAFLETAEGNCFICNLGQFKRLMLNKSKIMNAEIKKTKHDINLTLLVYPEKI